ncbi:MAG: exodeoxyribonuclease VII large subunit [Bacillota bacterium]|nr:exodeoxyribonuclease VII large subunit [Bacillota bacterium]
MAERVYPRTYSVEQIIFYIKEYLQEDRFLDSLAVSGEVSAFRAHSSGHVYFTLREGDHQLRVVLFRRYAALQQWLPRDGERVVVIGTVSLYDRDGSVQLYAQALLPAGEGSVRQAQKDLKQRLEEEGLFSPDRKKPMPGWASKVAVITAPDSAAWADMQRILYNRLPAVQLRLYPALVQGDQAPASLAEAISRADRGGHDVLLLGRGGGSEEDLSAFNTELVVRAIAAAKTPLISAVGHESDVSLADLAADLRAATPTHGASLAVPDAAAFLQKLELLELRLSRAALQCLEQQEKRLQLLEKAHCLQEPLYLLRSAELHLSSTEKGLQRAVAGQLEQKAARLETLRLRLEVLSPLATLARGYSLTMDSRGRILRDAKDCLPGDVLYIRLAADSLTAEVLRMEKEEPREKPEDSICFGEE